MFFAIKELLFKYTWCRSSRLNTDVWGAYSTSSVAARNEINISNSPQIV